MGAGDPRAKDVAAHSRAYAANGNGSCPRSGVGTGVGAAGVGAGVGIEVGEGVGRNVGGAVGTCVGDGVMRGVGAAVGQTKGVGAGVGGQIQSTRIPGAGRKPETSQDPVTKFGYCASEGTKHWWYSDGSFTNRPGLTVHIFSLTSWPPPSPPRE